MSRTEVPLCPQIPCVIRLYFEAIFFALCQSSDASFMLAGQEGFFYTLEIVNVALPSMQHNFIRENTCQVKHWGLFLSYFYRSRVTHHIPQHWASYIPAKVTFFPWPLKWAQVVSGTHVHWLLEMSRVFLILVDFSWKDSSFNILESNLLNLIHLQNIHVRIL